MAGLQSSHIIRVPGADAQQRYDSVIDRFPV
jgi:hypothetical protein